MKKKNLYKKSRMIKPLIIAAFVITAGVAALSGTPAKGGGEADILISTETEVGAQTGQETQETARSPETTVTQESLPDPVVYICGAVQTPGLYTCKEGSRIADVVDMAGGLLPDADDTCVNMAARVTDAQQIMITKKGETPQTITDTSTATGAAASPVQGSGLINLNTADEAALKTLPGIGEQKAKAIIDYRQSVGRFTKPEDVMNVSGIKDGAFNKIKDLITV